MFRGAYEGSEIVIFLLFTVVDEMKWNSEENDLIIIAFSFLM